MRGKSSQSITIDPIRTDASLIGGARARRLISYAARSEVPEGLLDVGRDLVQLVRYFSGRLLRGAGRVLRGLSRVVHDPLGELGRGLGEVIGRATEVTDRVVQRVSHGLRPPTDRPDSRAAGRAHARPGGQLFPAVRTEHVHPSTTSRNGGYFKPPMTPSHPSTGPTNLIARGTLPTR